MWKKGDKRPEAGEFTDRLRRIKDLKKELRDIPQK
jgi:hypothetical protein